MIKDSRINTKDNKYIEAVGRRKTSVARVRITPASKFSVVVNDQDFETYFPIMTLKKLSWLSLTIQKGSLLSRRN